MKRKLGFTMIEMLVVMGIIAILSGALMAGFGRVTKSAQRARAQETVSNVATSLTAMLQKKGRWPTEEDGAIKKHGGSDGSGYGTVEQVARVFGKLGFMNISYKGGTGTGMQLIGTDRCGIVDPWAQAVLKRTKGGQGTGKDLTVPSGGKVQDHVVYYAIDEDLDGIVEAQVCGERVKVRASAIAWSAGADGKLGNSYSKRSKDNEDNIYSWRRAQEVKK
ncbi:MAG: type II secretion system protein [Kiritimatiellae bacterium]|nr:type II secretion system protein [Kiritimatiellia bacterium]